MPKTPSYQGFHPKAGRTKRSADARDPLTEQLRSGACSTFAPPPPKNIPLPTGLSRPWRSLSQAIWFRGIGPCVALAGSHRCGRKPRWSLLPT